MNKDQDSFPDAFYQGLRTFNQQAFYEAHEHFEDAWRQTPTDDREFFRAFLHLSGGFYRLTQDRPEAARKFFSHAKKWLANFPDSYHGFDVSQIMEVVQRLINTINQKIPSDEILKDQFQPIQPKEGPNQ